MALVSWPTNPSINFMSDLHREALYLSVFLGVLKFAGDSGKDDVKNIRS